jgi:hypothetical protein
MCGRASSNSRRSACSGRRCRAAIGASVSRIARVGKIGAGDDILDPVENDGAGGGKQNFVLIGEQPTCREGTAAGQAANGIRIAKAADR